ncbi:MAG: helix-turn-helix domain-containing protein [Gammaproteobacteria bacterium]|nr:helix-turn-helix domain-containing protein [Gammaproteobacteria bacterium]
MNAAPGTETGLGLGVDATASIGAQLTAARKARKLEIDKVAHELKLDVAVIRALENDDGAALPAPIFVKGYLRSYARLVGLPEDGLVRSYAQQVGELPPLTVTRVKRPALLFRLPSTRLLRNIVLLLLLLIMLWLAWPFVERLLDSRGGQQLEQTPGHLELPAAGR